MRLVLSTVAALLLLAPFAHAQDKTPAPAASAAAPAAAASSAMPDRPSLEDIRNFTRVYEIIRQAYVKKVDNKTLMTAAIKGMLSELDPHSAYLDKQGMRELREETSGQYAGLGVVVTSRDQQLVVIAPIDDTPAAKAGLKPGDIILKIDGAPVDPQDVAASIEKLRGKAGSKITL
ncbi:MAG TPA: PDZ domain-containing protein, partial [Rhodanobacteraceae bacterium]|nr:PDZ domain-containing protein [Rhodanobacteraceae bacterium]